MMGFMYRVDDEGSNDSLIDLLPWVLWNLWNFWAVGDDVEREEEVDNGMREEERKTKQDVNTTSRSRCLLTPCTQPCSVAGTSCCPGQIIIITI